MLKLAAHVSYGVLVGALVQAADMPMLLKAAVALTAVGLYVVPPPHAL